MKILGMLIVGTGEADRYLPDVLKRLSEITDEIVVACNATDTKTRNLVAEKTIAYDFSKYEWGKQQHIIKQRFYNQCVRPRQPDWIVCVDSDEILDKRLDRERLEELANRGDIAYEFYCVQLWDKEDQMRTDGPWGNFYNVRFFKFISDAEAHYKQTPLHCGLAPVYAYNWRTTCEYMFKHYGYMKLADRKKKAERYKKYDPNAKYMSARYYNGILGTGRLQEFDENRFGERLRYTPRPISGEKIKRIRGNMKLYRIENRHGMTFIVDESQIENHKKNKSIVRIEEIKPADTVSRPEKIEPEKKAENVCDICGKVFKSARGVAIHKRSHE